MYIMHLDCGEDLQELLQKYLEGDLLEPRGEAQSLCWDYPKVRS